MHATHGRIADIAGTRIAVSTEHVIRDELTPSFGGAGINSAIHFVNTDQGLASKTLTQGTLVVQGTGIPIVADKIIELMYTAQFGDTRVIRADVQVITYQLLCTDAGSLLAIITNRAEGTIAAGTVCRFMNAAGLFVARIGSTGIIIVTVYVFPGAPTVATLVPCRAGVGIIAGSSIDGVRAAHVRIAGIISTRITVIAIEGSRHRTFARGAVVSRGARVVVRALCSIRLVDTADGSLTRIIGARIVVVATEGYSGLAL